MSFHIIPLGMRCQAVEVVSSCVSQPRYTFDWIQMNLDTMCQILSLNKSDIDNFIRNYLSCVDSTTKMHKLTSSWFPHDDIVDLEGFIQKYIRRSHRLLDTIHNIGTHKIFVIFFGTYIRKKNHIIAQKLISTVSTICKDQLYFFIVNCYLENKNDTYICDDRTNQILYIHEPLNKRKGEHAWGELTQKVSIRFKKYIDELNFQK